MAVLVGVGGCTRPASVRKVLQLKKASWAAANSQHRSSTVSRGAAALPGLPVDEARDLFLEPFQLFLFLGVLCLLHSPHMRWDVLSTIFTKTLLERTEINSS